MKKITYIFLSLLVGFVMASCSDNDESTVVAPVFPESQSFEIQPEEICEISFDANQVWRVTTDKQWLKFIDETGKYQSLTGKAGKQTIQVTVTDGAQGFSGDKALVQLTMANETQTIAELKRPAKERMVQMYTAKGYEMAKIDEFVDVTFGRAEQIGFEANFDWKIDTESLPEWLINAGSEYNRIENLCGEAGQPVSINRTASVDVEQAVRYQDLTGTITIRAIDSDYSCSFPISAPGIEAGKIQWIGSVLTLRAGLIWDDKGNHLLKDGASGKLSLTDDPAACQVLIRHNDFTCHFVEWDNQDKVAREIPDEEVWVEVVKQEGGILTLQAKNNMVRAMRNAVLFLVPAGVEVDYNTYFTRYNGKFNFNPAGFGIELIQYGLPGGFDIRKQEKNYSVSMAEAKIASNATEIAEKLGLSKVDNIYEYCFTAEEWDMAERIYISPLGLIYRMTEYEMFNSSFESMGVDTPKGWAEKPWAIGNTYDSSYATTYRSIVLDNRVPFTDITDTCLYLVIRDGMGNEVGAFVIRK